MPGVQISFNFVFISSLTNGVNMKRRVYNSTHAGLWTSRSWNGHLERFQRRLDLDEKVFHPSTDAGKTLFTHTHPSCDGSGLPASYISPKQTWTLQNYHPHLISRDQEIKKSIHYSLFLSRERSHKVKHLFLPLSLQRPPFNVTQEPLRDEGHRQMVTSVRSLKWGSAKPWRNTESEPRCRPWTGWVVSAWGGMPRCESSGRGRKSESGSEPPPDWDAGSNR